MEKVDQNTAREGEQSSFGGIGEVSKFRIFVEGDGMLYHSKKKLIQRNSSGIISIGEETYFNQILVIKLKGLTNPSMLRRMGPVNAAGIFNLVAKNGNAAFNVSQSQNAAIFKDTRLSGNVIVIFVQLLAGLTLALLGFILEVRGEAYKLMTEVFQNFKMWVFKAFPNTIHDTFVCEKWYEFCRRIT